MNKIVEEFIEKNGIDYDALKQTGQLKVQSESDINYIIASNRIYKNSDEKIKISIADILGYNYNLRDLTGQDLLYNMSYFFDLNGSGYQTRSVSMLDYSSDEIMERLMASFDREPIRIVEADKGGKYVIGDNGLHRFHVLKSHFLKEMLSLKPDDIDGYETLKEKYTFNAMANELDFAKTYSTYLLKKIAYFKGESIPDFQAELDQEYNYTGNLEITFSNNGKKMVLNNQQLIKFVQERFDEFVNDKSISSQKKKDSLSLLMANYEMFDSFKEHCDKNLPEFVSLMNKGDLCIS